MSILKGKALGHSEKAFLKTGLLDWHIESEWELPVMVAEMDRILGTKKNSGSSPLWALNGTSVKRGKDTSPLKV